MSELKTWASARAPTKLSPEHQKIAEDHAQAWHDKEHAEKPSKALDDKANAASKALLGVKDAGAREAMISHSQNHARELSAKAAKEGTKGTGKTEDYERPASGGLFGGPNGGPRGDEKSGGGDDDRARDEKGRFAPK